ncbi:MAG: transmembrane sensor [Paraglaciecola sp.]|jgi:transmembrane sensor
MSDIAQFPNTALIEEEACQWIVKFEGDVPPSKTEIEQFQYWMTQSATHKATLLRLASTWNDMGVLSGLSVPLGYRRPSMRSHIKKWVIYPLQTLVTLSILLARTVNNIPRRVAILPMLAVLLTIGISSWYVSYQPTFQDNVYITSLGEHSFHTLEDGSVLWLNTNTQVEVDYSESKRRINLLQGQAHFEVKPDPERPFEVYAGNRMIRAVGTAFSVYRLDDRIEVMVTEGKVDLSIAQNTLLITPEEDLNSDNLPHTGEASEPQTIKVLTSLVAGQSAVIPTTSSEPEAAITELEHGEQIRKLSWLEGKLVFAGESLEEVVREVSRHTPIHIEVSDPNLRNLRIGGQFQAGETDALFDVLESGFGIKITRLSNSHVQLHSK